MEMKEIIAEYVKLLPVSSSLNCQESERRAGKFLEAMAKLSDWKHQFTKTSIGQLSVQTATYAEQLAKGAAKTVTENKTAAEASLAYRNAREELESTENDISYLKAHYEIFSNAHVFYRQLSKIE